MSGKTNNEFLEFYFYLVYPYSKIKSTGEAPFHYILFDTTKKGVDVLAVNKYENYIYKLIESDRLPKGTTPICVYSGVYYMFILGNKEYKKPPLQVDKEGSPIIDGKVLPAPPSKPTRVL